MIHGPWSSALFFLLLVYCTRLAGQPVPQPLPGPVNTADEDESAAHLTSDGLTLLLRFNRPRPTVRWASRTSTSAEFGAPVPIPGLSAQQFQQAGPTLSADKLEFALCMYRGPVGLWDVATATRTSVDASFGPARFLDTRVNTPGRDVNPFLSRDGLTLYYASEAQSGNPNSMRGMFTRRLTRKSPWNAATPMKLRMPDSELRGMTVTSDELTVLLSSNIPGGHGGFDIYMATRASRESPWGAVVNLGSRVNSASDEQAPYVCDEDGRLYFSSNRGGTLDVFVIDAAAAGVPNASSKNHNSAFDTPRGYGLLAALLASAGGLVAVAGLMVRRRRQRGVPRTYDEN